MYDYSFYYSVKTTSSRAFQTKVFIILSSLKCDPDILFSVQYIENILKCTYKTVIVNFCFLLTTEIHLLCLRFKVKMMLWNFLKQLHSEKILQCSDHVTVELWEKLERP